MTEVSEKTRENRIEAIFDSIICLPVISEFAVPVKLYDEEQHQMLRQDWKRPLRAV